MTASIAGYITIDGKKYKVLAPEYKRGFEPAKTARRGVLGNTIVSIGPGNAENNTSAVLYIAFAPVTGYGSLVDLQTAAEKASVSYTDHVTGDSAKWGSGTYNITILKAEVVQLKGAPRPETGYEVYVEWIKVLS